MIEVVKRIIFDYQKKVLPALTERDLKISFIPNMAVGISGIRRGGKTFRTHQLARELEQLGKKENICRIQFNDHRIINIPANELHIIDDAYYSIYPEKRGNEDVFFVFDEIHRIEGWENYILYLLETSTHKIIITGSTASTLRGEFASSLRGKLFPYELFPFSFSEYLRHHNVEIDPVSTKGRSFLLNSLNSYLQIGGFPGVYDIQEELREDLLRTYWDTMLLRDIIEAHNNENFDAALLRHFCDALISRVGCPMTVNKISLNLKNSGFSFNQDKIYRYLKYINDAYMLQTVEFFSESEKIRARNYKKVYCIDWALARAVSYGAGTDDTRLFENMIYINLKRKGGNVSYYSTREGFEVDFVSTDNKKNIELIQVSYSLDKMSVQNREIRALLTAGKHLNAQNLTIITLNDEKTVKLDGMEINIVPAWKWLLS
ncbi:MAG: ATP-binding protein [bacterium]